MSDKINAQDKSKDFKLLKPKNDIVFQRLFNKDNERITKAFVEALLDKKVDKIIINEDKELLGDTIKDKTGILDLELNIDDREKVDVEIQLVKKRNFAERLLFYFSKLYSKDIEKGRDYTQAKRVVLIAILDYDLELLKFIEEMETIWKLREEKRPELVLTDAIEIRIISLEKVKNMYLKNKDSSKAQWLLFLDDPNSKEVAEIMKENKEIKEASVEVHKLSKDEKLQRLALLKDKAIMDEKAAYGAGVDDGIKQREREIIENMLSNGMPIEKIAKVTSISVEEITQIYKNSKK